MLTRLKKKFQSKIASVAEKLGNAGFTPNTMSLLGILLAVLSAAFYINAKDSHLFTFLAAVLLLLSGLCDALDGAIARVCSKTTVFGGFFDSVLDRYADALVYSAIILGGLCELHWGAIALVGSLLVSYTRARAEAEKVNMESVGLMERPERIIIVAIATLAGIYVEDALNFGILLLAVLTNITVMQRIFYFYRKTKPNKSGA